MVLKLAFTEPLLYCRETGYRTPKTAMPFKVLGSFNTTKNEVVPLGGRIFLFYFNMLPNKWCPNDARGNQSHKRF